MGQGGDESIVIHQNQPASIKRSGFVEAFDKRDVAFDERKFGCGNCNINEKGRPFKDRLE